MQTRFGHYPPGPFIGVLLSLLPDMEDSAAVEAAAATTPPTVAGGNPNGGYVMQAQFEEVIPYGFDAAPSSIPKALEMPGGGTVDPGPQFDPMTPKRKPNFNRCMDAAQHSALWEKFCRSLSNPTMAQACWSGLPESSNYRQGLCKDWFLS